MFASRTSAVLGRRACALVAGCSAVLHGLMVGDAANLAVGVLTVGMALACLYCARELWTAGTPRVWCVVAVMNLSMVALHWSMPGHHHGRVVTAAGTAGSSSTLMVVATLLSVAEAVVATAVLWSITRRRAISPAPQWN